MDDKRIIELVILYCKDELTASDCSELEIWLDEDQRHREIFRDYLGKYRKVRQTVFYDTLDEREAWHRLTRRITGTGRKKRIMRYYPYVASLVLLMVVSVFLYMRGGMFSGRDVITVEPGSTKAVLQLSDGRCVRLSADSMMSLKEVNGVVIRKGEEGGIHYLESETAGESVLNTIRVPRGGEYYLCLADGTKVWLNSESELTYPVSMGGIFRDVRLKGEAYFEVTGNESQPFRVTCGDSRISVLGTKFNIMAYDGQKDVVTTLVNGRVQVFASGDSLILNPGEQSLSGASGIDVRKVDAGIYIAWISGIFEFEEMSLGEITGQLERWYDVSFVYTDSSLREITFTGADDRHRPLNVVLGMIEKLSGVRFELGKEVITIYKE